MDYTGIINTNLNLSKKYKLFDTNYKFILGNINDLYNTLLIINNLNNMNNKIYNKNEGIDLCIHNIYYYNNKLDKYDLSLWNVYIEGDTNYYKLLERNSEKNNIQ